MQCQHKQNFVFALLKLILNFFSSLPKFPLIPKVSPSPKIKKLFLWLPVWDDELSTTPTITTFLAKPLPKFHSHSPSNAIR